MHQLHTIKCVLKDKCISSIDKTKKYGTKISRIFNPDEHEKNVLMINLMTVFFIFMLVPVLSFMSVINT